MLRSSGASAASVAAPAQVRQAVRRMLQSFEGPLVGLEDLGGLFHYLKLLQLSYSELGPPCFAGGGPHKAATLVSSCLGVWQQSKAAAAAAPQMPQQGPPSFMAFFLSSGLGSATLLPVAAQGDAGSLVEARGGLGGPPFAPFVISPLLQQLPCSSMQQLLRLLQLLARALLADGPRGQLVDQLGLFVMQQLRAAFSHRVSVHCVESKHPFGQHQETLAAVSFLPCRRLLVLLDPRTDLGGSEEGCSLTLSAEEEDEAVVFSMKHSGAAAANHIGPLLLRS